MYWGIDLGGTKIEGVVLASLDRVDVLARERIATESHLGAEHVINRIEKLVSELSKKVSAYPKVIGIAHPGVEDTLTKKIKNSNSTCLNGFPLREILEKKFSAQVELSNDANCFALAESIYGAAKEAEVVFGVIMGTGVGGGIVVNRKIIKGKLGIAGEWGHNELSPEGELCYCGKKGCVEATISGPALEHFYHSLSGTKKNLSEIVAAKDTASKQTIERLNFYFGKAISVVINILDPDCIVLGGGVSNIQSLYSEGIAAAKKFTFCDRFESKIVKNSLGDSAGVFGAAMLCKNYSLIDKTES